MTVSRLQHRQIFRGRQMSSSAPYTCMSHFDSAQDGEKGRGLSTSRLQHGQVLVEFVVGDAGAVSVPFDALVFNQLVENMLAECLFHQC